MNAPHLRLISFAACPYAQRTWIALLYKGAAFDMDFIDLANKPAWFLELNPRGKVPVLVVDQKTVLYESMLLNLFLDDLLPDPPMLAGDAIERAGMRMLMNEADFRLMPLIGAILFAKTEADYSAAAEQWQEAWRQAEEMAAAYPASCTPTDRASLSLADAAWAPLFDRLDALRELWGLALPASVPHLEAWRDRVLTHPAVLPTRLPDLTERYRVYRTRQDFLPPISNDDA